MRDYTTSWLPSRSSAGGQPSDVDGFVYRAKFDVLTAEPVWDIRGDNPQWIWVGKSTGWQGSIDWSITASHSHIDRTQVLGVHMGSSAGPTHSNERAVADTGSERGPTMHRDIRGEMTAITSDAVEIRLRTQF